MGTLNVEVENGQATNPEEEVRNLMELPFIPNAGQMPSEWAFEVKGQDYNFSFAPDKVQLQTAITKDWDGDVDTPDSTKIWTVQSSLVGAATNPTIAGKDKLPGVVNFINVPDPNNPGQTVTIADVETFGKIGYENVYPGITQIFKGEADAAGNEGKLTKEFHVAPGADYSQISIQYSGIDNVSTDSSGNLILEKNGWGKVTETAPFIFEDRNNDGEYNAGDVQVSGSYKLQGDFQVGFDVGDHDPNYALVIDPVLQYSTYLGGTQEVELETVTNEDGTSETRPVSPLVRESGADDAGLAIAVDIAGSAYITGETQSTLFPGVDAASSVDSEITEFSSKIFVTKLNPEGTEQVYSTYVGTDLGGPDAATGGRDEAKGIAVDLNGAVYVTGETESDDLVTTLNPFGGGSQDAFVFRLNPTGTGIDYSSYIGGPGRDRGLAIAVDASENAYIVGSTNSTGLAGEDTTGLVGGTDAFIAKINQDGTSQEYFAYVGGLGLDEATGVAVTDDGVAYITGTTESRGLATPGAAQSQIFGDDSDVFVAKVNEDAETEYFTYVGGSLDEVAGGIDLDRDGNAYITGITQSTDFPTTAGAFQEEYQGGEFDAFVSKIVERPEGQGGGTSFDYSTFVGGSGNEGINFALPRPVTGISVDSTGSAHVVGTTSSQPDSDAPFPITENATQSEFGGGLSDVFVTKLNPSGTEALYSSYLGGSGNEQGFAIGLDRRGAAFITGQTASTNFTTTPGSLDPDDPTGFGESGVDGFVSKIAFEGVSIIEDGNGLELTEGGRIDRYSIVLNTQPEGSVAVAISPDEQSRTRRTRVTFTPETWNIPRFITVAAADDAEVEGVHDSRIIHTAVSTDPSYNNIAIAELRAEITDDDAGINVTEIAENLEVAEGGATDSFEVALKTLPEGPVTIAIAPDDETTVSPTSLIFTSDNGTTPQTVTVAAVDDEEREDNPHLSTLTLTVTSEEDENYDGSPIAPITVEVADNDVATVQVLEIQGNLTVVENGAADTFDLVLTSQPDNDVTITINADENTTVEPTQVIFTPDDFDEPQEITVAAVNDRASSGVRFGTISFEVVSVDPAYNSISIDPITAEVTANEDGVLVSIGDAGDESINVTEGGNSDSYEVALAGPPTAEVTISIVSGNQTVNSPSELIFTPENFDEPQTVIVRAVDDSIGEGPHTDTIVHIATSEDLLYDGMNVFLGNNTLDVNITDNDQGEPPVTTEINLDVDGDGTTRAATDGQLILKYVQGLTGVALTSNGEYVGENALRSSANAIEAFLDEATSIQDVISGNSMLDADGNQSIEPNDARMIRRYLAGLTGNDLTADGALIGDFAARTTGGAIAAHLGGFDPSPQQSSNSLSAAQNTSSQNATSGDDAIAGTDGDDLLNGGPGDDTIDGGPGNDKISGDAGTDVLIGGPGSDMLVMRTSTAASDVSQADVVQDFEVGVDRIGLTAGVTAANLEQTFDGISKVTIAIAGLPDKVLGVVEGQTGTIPESSFVTLG